MNDPRASIPDTVLPAPDGSRWLARTQNLLISADRNGPVRITIRNEVIPVVRVEDGVAITLPNSTAVASESSIDLAEVPVELAVPLAAWMAAQAGPRGEAILAKVYPTQENAQ